MLYNHFRLFDYEYNECMGRGMCSIAPNISSFQEVMLILMRRLAYYVIKLEMLGKSYTDMKSNIINSISTLVTTTEYSDEQLLNIVTSQYNNLIKLKRDYADTCKKQGMECKELKQVLKLTPDMGLSEVLKQGQKAFLEKYMKMNPKQKCYAEILFVIIKSVSLSIVKLLDYGITDDHAAQQVLNALNMYNYTKLPINKIKNMISELAKVDLELWKLRNKAQSDTYGKISKTSVSFSTEQGKAILVSGSSLLDLNNLLIALKDEDNIDVYSHGDLLIAHAYNNFAKYPQFKGHFGTGFDNCILDFATFPGPILLTKHATQNIEYLIRGRLFTTDKNIPKGVIKLDNDDYSQLINSAKEAKGFSRAHERDDVEIGFNPGELENKLSEIAERFDNDEIKHIFIIGMSNYSSTQSKYFETLLKHIPKDCYVITLSYHCGCDNELYINIVNNLPLQLTIFDMLFSKIPINSDKLTFYLTKCDSNTISSMISLKENGVKNIYLSDCPPTVINPTVLKSFMELYCIKPISTPKNDLEEVLNKIEG